MWKRDEAVRPPSPTPPAAGPAASTSEPAASRPETPRPIARDIVNIGKSVVIKGELSASEDLTIEGKVDGKIDLLQNTLTIGANGRITADINAKIVVVLGKVEGNILATEKVDIRDNGSVDGGVSAPRVAIAEGAHFRGSIDMQHGGAKVVGDTKPAGDARPAGNPPSPPSPPASTGGLPSALTGTR